MEDAREQFVLAMERDRADRGLDRATTAAREFVRGLAPVNGNRPSGGVPEAFEFGRRASLDAAPTTEFRR